MNNSQIKKNIKKICKQIVLAQAASDYAKGHSELTHILKNTESNKKFYDSDSRVCYDYKDKCIMNALKIIDNTPRCGVNYYYDWQPDQNGYQSILIYFDIKIDETRLQVSFHSFCPSLRTRINKKIHDGKKPSKGRKTKWDHGSSRQNCEWLINHFGF